MEEVRKKSFLSWCLVIVWMAIIFCLSSITGDRLPSGPIFGIPTYYLHKLVHFTEYSILGIILFRAILISKPHLDAKKILALTIALAFIYAISDEAHQRFVPGRCGNSGDVIIDTLSALVGTLFFIRNKFMVKLKQA